MHELRQLNGCKKLNTDAKYALRDADWNRLPGA